MSLRWVAACLLGLCATAHAAIERVHVNAAFHWQLRKAKELGHPQAK